MKIKVRKPNLEALNEQGIPRDYAQVMDYFNKGLAKSKYPYVARRVPITVQEIKEKWIPSAKTNITLVAESEGQVVGSLTVFYDPKATDYEYASQRKLGDIGETADYSFNQDEIKKSLITALVTELRARSVQARFMAPVEDPFLKVLEEIGYEAKISEGVERYQKLGLSGKAKEYLLP